MKTNVQYSEHITPYSFKIPSAVWIASARTAYNAISSPLITCNCVPWPWNAKLIPGTVLNDHVGLSFESFRRSASSERLCAVIATAYGDRDRSSASVYAISVIKGHIQSWIEC